jgi:hypothetical protein
MLFTLFNRNHLNIFRGPLHLNTKNSSRSHKLQSSKEDIQTRYQKEMILKSNIFDEHIVINISLAIFF